MQHNQDSNVILRSWRLSTTLWHSFGNGFYSTDYNWPPFEYRWLCSKAKLSPWILFSCFPYFP